MSIEQILQERSNDTCELCASTENLAVYEVPPHSNGTAETCAHLCQTCSTQVDDPEKADAHHWRCLNDSMWSQIPAVQVLAWRMLTRLSGLGWPQDLLNMLFLEEETLAWAKAVSDEESTTSAAGHIDSNGAVLEAGDTVTLIKDLVVKGANFTAKRGTSVRSISLVAENVEHIEGRVSGQRIVILTKFVKKSG